MFTVDLINSILDLWLKPMVLLVLIVSIANTSYRFSASSSHWFLASAFFVTALATIFLPLFSIANIPSFGIEILPNMLVPLTQVPVLGDDTLLSISYVLLGAYMLGVFWILSFQIFGLIEILSISRTSYSVSDNRLSLLVERVQKDFPASSSAEVRVSKQVRSPLMWGHFSPIILLPSTYEQWSDSRLRRVLAHEQAHVQRNDWVVKMCGKLLSAVLWPIPMVWVVLNKMEWFAELSCDDRVIRFYDCRAEYAEDLLSLSREKEVTGWAMSFNRESAFFTRIKYVLDGRYHRDEMPSRNKCANVLMCVLLILPLFIMHLQPRASILFASDPGVAVNPAGKETKVEGSETRFEEPPQWPYDKKTFIRILPDSPKFTEEMTVTASHYLKDRDRTDKRAVRKNPPKASEMLLPTPQLEVKGVLPRVMHTPVYPKRAIRKGIEGQVMVQFDIDESGKVFNPRIVFSQPKNVFDKSVLAALKKSQFSPMKIEGRPVITKNISETFSFKLKLRSKSSADKPLGDTMPRNTEIAGLSRSKPALKR